jgi:hypothetical protein
VEDQAITMAVPGKVITWVEAIWGAAKVMACTQATEDGKAGEDSPRGTSGRSVLPVVQHFTKLAG